MKTEQETAIQLQRRKSRLITNSTDVDKKYRDEGWVDALRWVLEPAVKTEQEIATQLQRREIRLITSSTDVNRPLCLEEKYRDEGCVDALRWVLEDE